jgi:hypothetical protein
MTNVTPRRSDANAFALTKADFVKRVVSIKKRGKTLQSDIHTVLMAALASSVPHAEGGHLNATPFLQVMAALPDAVRASDVRSWIERHSNARITVKKTEAGKSLGISLLAPTHDDYKAVDFGAANAHPFYELIKKASDEAMLDDDGFARRLAALIKTADKAIEHDALNLSPVNLARLNALREMAAAVKPAAGAEQKVA